MGKADKELTMSLHNTLRVVLLETADAYRALSEDDIEAALRNLQNVAEYAASYNGNRMTAADEARMKRIEEFTVPNRPDGYYSIIGYCLRNGLYAHDASVDALVSDSLEDSRAIRKYMKLQGSYAALKVEAPDTLKELGIEQINAYPESILKAVLRP